MISVELVCPCGSSGPFAPLFNQAHAYRLTETDRDRERVPHVFTPSRPTGVLCVRCGRTYDDGEDEWLWVRPS